MPYAAREYLLMTTPYFVPSDDLLHVARQPASAAWMSVYYPCLAKRFTARRLGQSRAFSELLAAGVKIISSKAAVTYQKRAGRWWRTEFGAGTVNSITRSLWLTSRDYAS